VFAATLVMGAGVLRAAHERNVRVPHDLSVIALHDDELADYLEPPLSTIAMPTEQMARAAVDLLVRRIEGGKGEHLVVPHGPELALRSSTAPVY
jgi:LacI family transcriptional regulator